jgi:hypothetical protein
MSRAQTLVCSSKPSARASTVISIGHGRQAKPK